jgi:hypothetical protein
VLNCALLWMTACYHPNRKLIPMVTGRTCTKLLWQQADFLYEPPKSKL